MSDYATTRMSSKGQIVIPESVRKRLKLEEGVEFVVIGEGDVVVLKVISPPSMDAFDGLIRQARQQAKAAGLQRSEISKAISRAREKK